MNRPRSVRVAAVVCIAVLAGAAPGRAVDGPTDETGLWLSVGAALAAVAAMTLVDDSEDDSAPTAADTAPAVRILVCDPPPPDAPDEPPRNCMDVLPGGDGAAAAFAAAASAPGDPRLTLRPAARPGRAGLLARYRFADDRDASLGLAAGRDGEAAFALRYSLRW